MTINKPAKPKVSLQRLKQVLSYDAVTGVFVWLVDIRCGFKKSRTNVRSGDKAGCLVTFGKNSYIQIRIDGVLYSAHSLAWFYQTGQWASLVDHRDMDATNNIFENLRAADKSKNGANRGAPINNTSGFKGVYFDAARGKWAAEIMCAGVRHRLGRFGTKESAAAAYAKQAGELFGEFARAT